MTASCSRLWQVEAARDGRLSGKDLASAMRHRETCAECAQEERALAALGHTLASLPELERNALSSRRTRQSLMAALNDALIAIPRPKYGARIAAFAAFAALVSSLLGTWLVVRARRVASLNLPPIVDVYAAPGARWSAHTDARLVSVDFVDGAASFVVHPHQGRRVVVRLPDGEVEDMGTVFEVRVNEQHTRRVAVSEGKVVVRLLGRPAFSLAAGEAWELAPAASASAAPKGPPASAAPSAPAIASGSAATPGRRVVAPAPPAASTALDASPDSSSANAEDDAYLQIVSLLRTKQVAEARSQAKSYLLRFPNGFRRVEVLNIAMRGGNDAADASTSN
jgi:hypothetical protein